MARAKKDGQFLNCYVRKEIFERLTRYSDNTLLPKTAVVEKALEKYLNEVMEAKSKS